MSSHTYPRTMPPQWRERESFGKAALFCETCHQPIGKGERVMVEETQVSWMRGDDQVTFACEKCANAAGHKSPPTKEQRRVEALKSEQRGLIRSIEQLGGQLVNKRSRLAEVERTLKAKESATTAEAQQ